MTDDVGMLPLGVIVARLVDKLARPDATPASGMYWLSPRGEPGIEGSTTYPREYPSSIAACLLPTPLAISAEAELEIAAGGAAGEALTPACRHGSGGGTVSATILEFGKKGGDRSRPQWVLQGGEQTVAVRKTVTAGTAGLGYARAKR